MKHPSRGAALGCPRQSTHHFVCRGALNFDSAQACERHQGVKVRSVHRQIVDELSSPFAGPPWVARNRRSHFRYSGTRGHRRSCLGALKVRQHDRLGGERQIWRHPGSYDPTRGSVRAWLGVLMRSRALDRRRARGSREALRALAPPAISASEDPARARDRVVVRRALHALPLEQRQVLELTYFEDLSASEIAARMGAPIGTVKSRRAAALQKLRTAFGCKDVEPE